MDKDLVIYPKPKDPTKFKVVGLIPSAEYQKCRFLVQKLHDCFPTEYAKPEIRGMLNLDWDEYLTKMKRRHGKAYYLLRVPVAVYKDGILMGDHKDLVRHIAQSYILETNLNFEEMANQDLIDYFSNITNLYKRKFAYLTISIDERVVGSMLFMLYNDLCPITCDNFLNRCINSQEGYKGTKIHRIAKYSWVQCGGVNLQHHHMPCENYTVPHNRRGVLSMCNERRHKNNSTQFFIALEAADWMDHNYVAFGYTIRSATKPSSVFLEHCYNQFQVPNYQAITGGGRWGYLATELIQGAEILNSIEAIPTYYQKPMKKIQITQCGEFSLCPQREEEYERAMVPPYEALFEEIKPDEVDSVLSVTGFKQGKYFLRTDLKPYLPFSRYSKMFDIYLKDLETGDHAEMLFPLEEKLKRIIEQEENEEEEEEASEPSSGKSLNDMRKVVNSKTFYFAGDHLIV